MCVDACRTDQEPECPPGLEMRPACCSQKYCDRESTIFCHALGKISFTYIFYLIFKSLEESAQECACVKKEDNTMMKCLNHAFLLKNVQELQNAQLMKSGTVAEPLALPSVENHENNSA